MTTSPVARSRLPRLVETAAVRSRLALVPPRSTTARRTPFVVLICLLLVGGVVGLLMFNTQMQQTSFHATALQQRATALRAQQQDLAMQLQAMRNPQELAQRARALGMVVPAEPAFLRLSDGKVLGTPTMTTAQDGMRVRGFAADKPSELAPRARIIRVPATTTSTTTGSTTTSTSGAGATSQSVESQTTTGAASPPAGTTHGRKNGKPTSNTTNSANKKH